jgi:hypothetical protein
MYVNPEAAITVFELLMMGFAFQNPNILRSNPSQ